MMQLTLFLNGKALTSVPLKKEHLRDADFLTGARQALEEQFADVINLSPEAPEFCIEGVDSCMNNFESLVSRHTSNAVDDLLNKVLFPDRTKRYRE